MADARNQARRWKIRSYEEQQIEQEERSRGGGNRYHSMIKLPEGVKFFKFPDPEKHPFVLLDVIPFLTDYTGELELRSEVQYFRHVNIGKDHPQNVLCPKRTFGLPCPICEAMSKLDFDDPDDARIRDALKPKERRLYFVRWLDGPSENKKDLYVLDQSQFLFGQLIKNKLAIRDREDPEESRWPEFFDLQHGFMLKIGLNSEPYRGTSYIKPVSLDFKPRSHQYVSNDADEEAFLEKIPDLYKCLNPMSYDELDDLYQSSHTRVDVPLNSSPTQPKRSVAFDPTQGYTPLVQEGVSVFTAQRSDANAVESDMPF